MKHSSFLWLPICMVTCILDTNCMLHALHNTKTRLIILPQQRRCSTQISLQQRIKLLENQVSSQEKQLTAIKAIIEQWDNNNQSPLNYGNLPRVYDSFMDQRPHDSSFINEHNMHYENRSQQ